VRGFLIWEAEAILEYIGHYPFMSALNAKIEYVTGVRAQESC
jgi:hypothetical protein